MGTDLSSNNPIEVIVGAASTTNIYSWTTPTLNGLPSYCTIAGVEVRSETLGSTNVV